MKKQKKYFPCIIDTDPGVDDSAALALSLVDDIMDIKLITTVVGNLDLQSVTRNALHILEKFGFEKKIPLAVGASKPMYRDPQDAKFIHQSQGMGGYIPPKTVKTKPIKKDAVEAMYEVIKQYKNEIVIIAVGPHTNIGYLLQKHPDVVYMIKHIYCEGCAPYGYKNEKYISFNVSSDPEAFKLVVESGIPITIVPSRMGREQAHFTEEEVYYIRDLSDTGRWIFEMYSGYWEPKYPDRRVATNDTCATTVARFPKMFKSKRTNIIVNIDELPGKTIMDWNKKGHIEYVYKVNRKKLHNSYFNAVEKYSPFKFYKENGESIINNLKTYEKDPRKTKIKMPEEYVHMVPSKPIKHKSSIPVQKRVKTNNETAAVKIETIKKTNSPKRISKSKVSDK